VTLVDLYARLPLVRLANFKRLGKEIGLRAGSRSTMGRAPAGPMSGRVGLPLGGPSMPVARFRVRTLMAAVGVVALLVWGAMMGSRSYDYYRRSREYGAQERGWRELATRGPHPWKQFRSECAEYFAQLTAKYRRAMWRPWLPVAPDPPAPGFLEYQEQQRRLSLKSRAG
jgi:hypothetical protein